MSEWARGTEKVNFEDKVDLCVKSRDSEVPWALAEAE